MSALASRMTPNRAGRVFERCVDPRRFDASPVTDFVEWFSPAPAPWLLPPSGARFVGDAHARIVGEIAARDPHALPEGGGPSDDEDDAGLGGGDGGVVD